MQKSSLFAAIIGGLVAFFLITHTSIFSQKFLPKPSVKLYAAEDNTKVYVGEFPSEQDFKILKDKGVTSVVSLLDPTFQDESADLDKEKSAAKDNGMKFINFPMSADRRCSFIIKDRHQARLASRYIQNDPGPVYLHANRDVHRTAQVQEYLPENTSTSQFIAKDTVRKDRVLLTEIQIAYDREQNKKVLQLSKKAKQDPWVYVLCGWSHYRLGQIKEAKRNFFQAYSLSDHKEEPNNGLGYCSLRENNVDDAEMRFQDSLKENPHDCEALTGMGFVRLRQGRTPEAVHYFREVLAMNPGDYDAWVGLRMAGHGRIAAHSVPAEGHSHPSGY